MQNAISNREKIRNIRMRMFAGEITYAEAKIEAQPIIDEINAKAKELAKKYNTTAPKMSFAAMMR